MSMNIYAGITRTHPKFGRVMGPVFDFNRWDEENVAEDADARVERGESAFIPNPDYVEDAGMTLSNGNARALLGALGFALDEDDFAQLPIDEVQRACLKALNGPAAQAVTPSTVSGAAVGEPGPTMIDCGRPEGYMERRLRKLAAIIARGRREGATHLVVG